MSFAARGGTGSQFKENRGKFGKGLCSRIEPIPYIKDHSVRWE